MSYQDWKRWHDRSVGILDALRRGLVEGLQTGAIHGDILDKYMLEAASALLLEAHEVGRRQGAAIRAEQVAKERARRNRWSLQSTLIWLGNQFLDEPEDKIEERLRFLVQSGKVRSYRDHPEIEFDGESLEKLELAKIEWPTEPHRVPGRPEGHPSHCDCYWCGNPLGRK